MWGEMKKKTPFVVVELCELCSKLMMKLMTLWMVLLI